MQLNHPKQKRLLIDTLDLVATVEDTLPVKAQRGLVSGNGTGH